MVGSRKFGLSWKEFWLGFCVAVLGFLLSSRVWLRFLDGVGVFWNFLIYYVILYGFLFVLSRLGLTVFGFRIRKPLQVFGLLLIAFAVFVCIDWESPYVNIVTRGTAEGVSTVYFGAEDGVSWAFWSSLGFENLVWLRWLTFIVTPFVLCLIGGFLVRDVESKKFFGGGL